jgi:hypothetical protein
VKRFVKSADTSTPIGNSRAEIERILRRYGASGFAVSQDYAEYRVTVTFTVPNSRQKDAIAVPVRLPVSVHAVYDALYGQPITKKWVDGQWVAVHDRKGYNAKKLEQAERVAWRHLVLWIDAALTAADAGVQTITEAFFAHAIIPTEQGPRRMIDVIDAAQQYLGNGVQRLLAAPAETASQ